MPQPSIIRSRAFTLIELLIVVAIIAILAAIAVPNFLEAQTRSKVSRSKSDMRTVATAVESYYVDNNSYPYTETIGPAAWLLPGGYPREGNFRCGGLTSPISYITSLPIDPFVHVFRDSNGNQIAEVSPYYFERAGFGFVDGVRTNARGLRVPADAVDTPLLTGIGADTVVNDPNRTPRQWLMFSVGPNLTLNVTDANGTLVTASRYNLANRYDPTNGTVSEGNILRFPGGESFP